MTVTGPAWQIRAHERQRLVDGLMREVYDLEERIEDRVRVDAALATLLMAHRVPNLKLALTDTDISDLREFATEIITRVRKFERSVKEGSDILWDIIVRLVDSARIPARGFREEEERVNPQLIFHADSATDEVTVSDEGPIPLSALNGESAATARARRPEPGDTMPGGGEYPSLAQDRARFAGGDGAGSSSHGEAGLSVRDHGDEHC